MNKVSGLVSASVPTLRLAGTADGSQPRRPAGSSGPAALPDVRHPTMFHAARKAAIRVHWRLLPFGRQPQASAGLSPPGAGRRHSREKSPRRTWSHGEPSPRELRAGPARNSASA